MLIFGNKHLDLPPQLGVFAAGLIEKRSAIFNRPLQCGVEDLLGSPPKLLLHGQLRTYCHLILLRSEMVRRRGRGFAIGRVLFAILVR